MDLVVRKHCTIIFKISIKCDKKEVSQLATRKATQITSISTHDGGRGSREMAKFHPPWMRHWIQIHMYSNYRKTIWYEYSWQTCKFCRESANIFILLRVEMFPQWVHDFPFLEATRGHRAGTSHVTVAFLEIDVHLLRNIWPLYKTIQNKHNSFLCVQLLISTMVKLNVEEIFNDRLW